MARSKGWTLKIQVEQPSDCWMKLSKVWGHYLKGDEQGNDNDTQ